MATIFVRHREKVFGPFTQERVDQLLQSGQFDAAAEFAWAWNGPWATLEAFRTTLMQSGPSATHSAPTATTALTPLVDGTENARQRSPDANPAIADSDTNGIMKSFRACKSGTPDFLFTNEPLVGNVSVCGGAYSDCDYMCGASSGCQPLCFVYPRQSCNCTTRPLHSDQRCTDAVRRQDGQAWNPAG